MDGDHERVLVWPEKFRAHVEEKSGASVHMKPHLMSQMESQMIVDI